MIKYHHGPTAENKNEQCIISCCEAISTPDVGVHAFRRVIRGWEGRCGCPCVV